MNESKLSRRVVLKRSLTVLAALPVASLLACGGETEVHCGGPNAEQQAARAALQYAEHGPDETRRCHLCQLFTGTATACGSCQLLQGEINPQGSCTSFIRRA